MRGIYTVVFQKQAFTTANADYDFFEFTPADDKPIELVALLLSVKTEVGDAQDEMLDYSIVTDNATTGNGAATTPRPLDPSDGGASFTAESVASTPASTGTALIMLADTFNVRSGLQLILPAEMRPKVSQADVMMCVRLDTALADDATLSGTAWIKEL